MVNQKLVILKVAIFSAVKVIWDDDLRLAKYIKSIFNLGATQKAETDTKARRFNSMSMEEIVTYQALQITFFFPSASYLHIQLIPCLDYRIIQDTGGSKNTLPFYLFSVGLGNKFHTE